MPLLQISDREVHVQIDNNIWLGCVIKLLQGSLECLTDAYAIMETHLAPDSYHLDSALEMLIFNSLVWSEKDVMFRDIY